MNNQNKQLDLSAIVIQLQFDFDQEFEQQENSIEEVSNGTKTGKIISLAEYQEKKKLIAYRKILNNAKK
jgi:hypothetical protein